MPLRIDKLNLERVRSVDMDDCSDLSARETVLGEVGCYRDYVKFVEGILHTPIIPDNKSPIEGILRSGESSRHSARQRFWSESMR